MTQCRLGRRRHAQRNVAERRRLVELHADGARLVVLDAEPDGGAHLLGRHADSAGGDGRKRRRLSNGKGARHGVAMRHLIKGGKDEGAILRPATIAARTTGEYM